MELRDYQKNIVEEIGNSYSAIINAKTGSGKSLIIAEICRRYSTIRIVILTNISSLITQISSHLDAMGVDHSILKAGMDDRFDATKDIQLVMEQTYFARNIKLKSKIIIKDEYHIGWDGERFKSIVSELGTKAIYGFTATPYDDNGVVLPHKKMINGPTIDELTLDGYLLPMKTYIAKFSQRIDLDDIGKGNDYTSSELDEVINTSDYNQGVVDSWKLLPRQHKQMKTICFIGGIEHAEALAIQFEVNGVKSRCVHSKQPSSLRTDIIKEFDDREVEVLIGVSSLHTGYDAPDIECVINCRPTKRRSLKEQMEGRGLRIHESLKYGIILDCARATETHGLYNANFIPYESIEAAKMDTKPKEPYISYYLGSQEEDIAVVNDKILSDVRIKVVKSENIDALIAKYDTSTTAKEMVELGCKIYEKAHGIVVEDRTISWVTAKVDVDSRIFGLKSFKTRLRNIIKNKQKVASLYYFGNYLRENAHGY